MASVAGHQDVLAAVSSSGFAEWVGSQATDRKSRADDRSASPQ
jgi:hypothetical protein